MCVIVNVPDWLVQPGVWPVSVNVPEPDIIPAPMLACMVMVFVSVLPEGVQDMVRLIVPAMPLIMFAPI